MSLAIDGTVQVNNFGSGVLPALTTAAAGLVVVAILINGTNVASITGGGLTFVQRNATNSGFNYTEEWVAISAAPLAGVVLTINGVGSISYLSAVAFGISGCDTVTKYDANASIPATGTTSALSVSTNTADTIILGVYRMSGTPDPTAGTGFTALTNGSLGGFLLVEYKIVSATQSSLSVGIGTGAGDQTMGLADAIIMASSAVASSHHKKLTLLGVG